ncbi:MAG: hypothetical protein QM731_01400 [Chitinophagaceae bacterium]
MQSFKTNTKLLQRSTLKNWGWTIGMAILLFITFRLVLNFPIDKVWLGIIVIFVIRLGDAITEFHVREIRIDTAADQLTFILRSIMSGEKIRSYPLQQAASLLKYHSGFISFLSFPLTLIISLPKKEYFKINSRYGFSADTLTAIDTALKQTKKD